MTQGDYAQKKVYGENPLELARSFEKAGIRRLHLVDLDGARQGKVVNWEVLEAIANNTSLELDFGGGIKTDDDIRRVFSYGVALAAIGSIAVTDSDLFTCWVKKYGPEKILPGADTRDGKIAISGWSEGTQIDILDFIASLLDKGIPRLFSTDISKDGKMEGPSFALYEKILKKFPGIKLIASGGVTRVEDIVRLEEIGCSGVIIGKALYEGKISPEDLKPFLED